MPDDTSNDTAETAGPDAATTDAARTPATPDAAAESSAATDTARADSASADSAAADSSVTGTRRRPSPAAAAASRARRIGGSTAAGRSAATGTPKASTDTATGASTTSGAVADSVSMTKASANPSTKRARTLREDDETATGTTEPAPKRTKTPREAPGWLRWLPAAVLVAGALVMLIVLAAASHGVWWGQPSANEARDKVLAAAKTCTVNTNSYSYLTFDADEKKGKACTTGAQTQRYTNAMETLIRAKAKTLKASQVAQINTAGVQAITKGGRQWTILVFGQIKIITSQTGKAGRIDPFAARVRMDNVNGTWLLSAIDTVTSAAP